MGISFTFVSILSFVGAQYGYGAIMGAVLIGGMIEGVLGLFAKSFWKQLSVLFGLIVGYILAVCMHMVDFSSLAGTSLIAIPQLMPFRMEFRPDAIVSVVLIFLVSATVTALSARCPLSLAACRLHRSAK